MIVILNGDKVKEFTGEMTLILLAGNTRGELPCRTRGVWDASETKFARMVPCSRTSA